MNLLVILKYLLEKE